AQNELFVQPNRHKVKPGHQESSDGCCLSTARSKRCHASSSSSLGLCGDLTMPRQPYLSVTPRQKGVTYDLGTHCIGARPELERLICACIMMWPFVEAEMAVALGLLLEAKTDTALAVFESLRRSSAQRDAIATAAEVALNARDRELLSAVLNIHKAIEA